MLGRADKFWGGIHEVAPEAISQDPSAPSSGLINFCLMQKERPLRDLERQWCNQSYRLHPINVCWCILCSEKNVMLYFFIYSLLWKFPKSASAFQNAAATWFIHLSLVKFLVQPLIFPAYRQIFFLFLEKSLI